MAQARGWVGVYEPTNEISQIGRYMTGGPRHGFIIIPSEAVKKSLKLDKPVYYWVDTEREPDKKVIAACLIADATLIGADDLHGCASVQEVEIGMLAFK